RVRGAGTGRTILQAPRTLAARWVPPREGRWNVGTARIHHAGDRIVYRAWFPAAGRWQVWLRYATDLARWGRPGLTGRTTLAIDGRPPVALDDLPNTGSFQSFRWSRCATIEAPAGARSVTWRNVAGGGIHADAFVFALDGSFTPSDRPFPRNGPAVVVIQAENAADADLREGDLPGVDRAAVWLSGDGAGLSGLTVSGTPQTSQGVLVRSQHHPRWIVDCRVEQVDVRDVEGQGAGNCGVRLDRADRAWVHGCELWGGAPILLAGARRCRIFDNRLVAVTVGGVNSEGYILGRNDVVRHCVIERNVCASPPWARAGGPSGRRMIWLSTGRGSVAFNWIAGNREERARFGGVAGTDQNVGETILFEAMQRIAYFGPLEHAGVSSVTVPAVVGRTPDRLLGSVKRDDLSTDVAGVETPFWPPQRDDDPLEPPVDEYLVTIVRGRGMGQTRQVLSRQGATYGLDRPWTVTPSSGSLTLVHTGFYRNLLVDNRCVDGMSGIQLWIGCVENVMVSNEIRRMRKPGLFLYGTCTTLASSMPRAWNSGIGPLFFNLAEGTLCEESSAGALVWSGQSGQLPVEFPVCLGNVIRRGSFTGSREAGVRLAGPRGERMPDEPASVEGTVVEHSVVRDAPVGFQVGPGTGSTLLRRNHVYFWRQTQTPREVPAAYQVDAAGCDPALELNTVEKANGESDPRLEKVRRRPGPAVVPER
ncbi:MAG: hypothetical protein HY815_07415, partial [Candidatus Riflebacteria bacterium]|nr:hypothetical protein [Candidatus Riflebacteria bacterium]